MIMDNITANCQHCGKDLPVNHTGPCPHCGKTGKKVSATFTENVRLTASVSARKIHEYKERHPRFILISVILTIIGLVCSYILIDLVALLIGGMVAVLNFWLTPHLIETIREITYLGDVGIGADEVEQKSNSLEDICRRLERKLEGVEGKIDSSNRLQKLVALCALGIAFAILGLSHWPGLMTSWGWGTTCFYRFYPVFCVAVGLVVIVYGVSKWGRKR